MTAVKAQVLCKYWWALPAVKMPSMMQWELRGSDSFSLCVKWLLGPVRTCSSSPLNRGPPSSCHQFTFLLLVRSFKLKEPYYYNTAHSLRWFFVFSRLYLSITDGLTLIAIIAFRVLIFDPQIIDRLHACYNCPLALKANTMEALQVAQWKESYSNSGNQHAKHLRYINQSKTMSPANSFTIDTDLLLLT